MRAIFLMEQHIGHQTYYENLRRFAEHEIDLQSVWVPITYKSGNKLLDLVPGLSSHIRGTLHGALQVWHALGATGYDVAFFNTQVPAALATRQVRRRPYVLATDITPIQYDRMAHLYGHSADRAGLIASFKHRANVAIMRGATYILPWSTWTRNSLIQDYGVSPERIDVVPPGVDLALWKPGERQERGPLRILFVGGDLYRKGGATMLDAFRAMPKGAAELHLVTRTQIQPEEGVYTYYAMRPNSPELIALYQQSDVFVLPTEAEAFGIAAIEASASGLAVISSAVGGLVDIVDDEKTGYLITPKDSAALQERLRRLLDNPALRTQMGRAARARAERYFDARRNTTRIIDHLREAVSARAPVPRAS